MYICAILPIKHLSSRVPGKNYRDFNGKPLFTIILDTLLKCSLFDKIVIDTNSDTIKEIINSDYKNKEQILIYNRPQHLWDGDIAMNIILENVINDLKLTHDLFFQTHTTNPILSCDTINKSIKYFFDKKSEGYDSLFSVKEWQTRLYTLKNEVVEAVNHNPNELLPTQDLEPLYEENSCIYIFSKEILFKKKHRIGYKPLMFIMDDVESMDIDIETDFVIAESVHKCLILDKQSQQTVEQNKLEPQKTVLVTGANGGIGTEICKKFKNDNWFVFGTSIEETCNNPNIDSYFQADFTNSESIKNLIDNVKSKTTTLNCLVNNAASQICKPVWEMEEKEWDLVFNCNVKAIYLLVKNSLELLKQSNGNIVNVGSVHSVVTSDQIAAYATTKAAIVGLTKNLAIELSKFNIRVNCVSPGAVNTKMLKDGLMRGHVRKGNPDELVEKLGESHLLGKVGEPEEIANLVKFISDNKNGEFINGANILIDGGASIKLSTE